MKLLRKQGALLIGASVCALMLAGCSGEQGGGQAAATPAATAASGEFAQAQSLYKTNCLSCHGANLEGRVGPTTNLQKVGATRTKEQIAQQIANGGGGMPMFKTKLKADEVAALAEWLSTKK